MDIDVLASDRDRLVLRLPADEYLGRGMVTLVGGLLMALFVLLFHYGDTRGLFVGGYYDIGRVWEALFLSSLFWVHSCWHLYRAARGGDVVVFDRRADTVTRNGHRLGRFSDGALLGVQKYRNHYCLILTLLRSGGAATKVRLDATLYEGERLRMVGEEFRRWRAGEWGLRD